LSAAGSGTSSGRGSVMTRLKRWDTLTEGDIDQLCRAARVAETTGLYIDPCQLAALFARANGDGHFRRWYTLVRISRGYACQLANAARRALMEGEPCES